MIVPFNSWNVHVGLTGLTTSYFTLGPIGPARYIVEVRFNLNVLVTAGTPGVVFTAVLSRTAEENAAALQAGTPLIQRSARALENVKAIQYGFSVSDNVGLRLPVGVRTQTSAVWVLCAAAHTAADIYARLTSSLVVVAFGEAPPSSAAEISAAGRAV